MCRPTILDHLSSLDKSDFLNSYAAACERIQIRYLWRPFLKDPNDDALLELAFAASARFIVTHNVSDFKGSEKLKIRIITPRDFLKEIIQ
ncbi:putative toxin-antitoxin system toxin component, PIN family [Nibricoccus sp. IMCC34717]|uniref:PIN domain-containing protein n=1 Tax=Nibricoccus sp. IMCC34717 TaxID=3034021 RepID=UPI0038501327